MVGCVTNGFFATPLSEVYYYFPNYNVKSDRMSLAGWRSGGFNLLVERILPVDTCAECNLFGELHMIKDRWLALLY